jgi:NADH:ubiquinone oxidoreductase subunit E
VNPLELTICLGSSCFARGNRNTLAVIQEYLKQNKLENKVVFKGNHCFSLCNKGPVMKINDRIYEGITPESACRILEEELKNAKIL